MGGSHIPSWGPWKYENSPHFFHSLYIQCLVQSPNFVISELRSVNCKPHLGCGKALPFSCSRSRQGRPSGARVQYLFTKHLLYLFLCWLCLCTRKWLDRCLLTVFRGSAFSWFASASKKLITLNRGLHIILYILDSGVFLSGEATLHWFLINNKGER